MRELSNIQDSVYLFVILLLVGVPVFAQECPSSCRCLSESRGWIIECSYQELSDYKDIKLPSVILLLGITFTAKADIYRSSFSELNLPQSKKLRLQNCQIGTIYSEAFLDRRLTSLEFVDNSIQEIKTEAFAGLPDVYEFKLSGNTISSLENGAFTGMDLDVFESRNNTINIYTSGVFMGLRVKEVMLVESKFSKITSEMLDPLKDSMQVFQLINNGIPVRIEETAFEGTTLDELIIENSVKDHAFLKYVTTVALDLSKNKFTSFEFGDYDGLATVNTADLSSIGLEYLDTEVLRPFTGLHHLILSRNNITFLTGTAFRYTPELTKLEIVYNPIMYLGRTFGEYLDKLEELSFRGCKITELIDPSPFIPMANLEILDLDDNLIQVVGSKMEPILNRLSKNGLSLGSHFYCNCENLWFKQWLKDTASKPNSQWSPIECANLESPVDIRRFPEEKMTCTPPEITKIKGSSDYSVVSGNEAILEVPEGATIRLDCTGASDPAPTIQWSFPFDLADDVAIEPSSNRSDLTTASHYQLKDIRLDQSGKYKCSATNIENTTEAYIQVLVKTDFVLPTTTTTTTTTTKTTHTDSIAPTSPGFTLHVITTDKLEYSTDKGTQNSSITLTTMEPSTRMASTSKRTLLLSIMIPLVIILFIIIIVIAVLIIRGKCKKDEHQYDVAEAENLNSHPNPKVLVNLNGEGQVIVTTGNGTALLQSKNRHLSTDL